MLRCAWMHEQSAAIVMVSEARDTEHIYMHRLASTSNLTSTREIPATTFTMPFHPYSCRLSVQSVVQYLPCDAAQTFTISCTPHTEASKLRSGWIAPATDSNDTAAPLEAETHFARIHQQYFLEPLRQQILSMEACRKGKKKKKKSPTHPDSYNCKP